MRTEEIAAHQVRTGVHPNDVAGCGRVSSTSEWSANRWQFDLRDSARPPSEGAISWDPRIASEITEALKVLTWSLFVSRRNGHPLRYSALIGIRYPINYLAGWMHRSGYRSFGSLTGLALQKFRDDLVVYLSSGETPEERQVDVSPKTVAAYLRPLLWIEEQTRYLQERGVAPMPSSPFGLASLWDVALGIVDEVESFAPPLPDEVVLPVVREAHLWLDERAEDILRLQQVFIDELGKKREQLATRSMVMRRLRGFTFSAPRPGEPPWHPPFEQFIPSRDQVKGRVSTHRTDERQLELLDDSAPWEADQCMGDPFPIEGSTAGASDPDGTTKRATTNRGNVYNGRETLSGTDLIRRLICHLIAACATVIRFQTGIRHGELFSFEPGLDDDGIPRCVEREGSLSGAYDMFFVKGQISKGEHEPQDTRWLLAGRLHDDPILPDAVNALVMLNRVTEPWRSFSDRQDTKEALLVIPGNSGLAHDPASVRPMTHGRLASYMRGFIWDNVDLSGLDRTDERLAEYVRTGGACVTARQWRKTWANWMIRVDKRLLPAISQQFHHRSVLLTEEAYIGKDAMQLGLVESAAMERAVQYMRRAMSGEEHVGGGMKKVIASELDDLKERVAGMSIDAQQHEIRTWLLDRDIRIWSSPHGKCFVGMMPTDARCHEVAGTIDYANQSPSFMNRTPQLCSGCRCFAVDEDDLPFWTERYLENRRIWEEAVKRKMEVTYAVANERWQQSAKILQSLGVNVAQLSEEAAHATHR